MNLEKTPFIENLIDQLVNRKQGKFVLATGSPGCGKSLSWIRIAEKVDTDFNLDQVAIGKTSEFIGFLEMATKGKLEHGTAIMLDEAGVGMPARDWYSAQNKILGLVFQVIRKLGLLVVMTLPARRMLDVHGRILMKYYSTGEGIDYDRNRSIFRLYEIKYDDWTDTILRYKLRDEAGQKIDFWEIALPTNINLKEYEEEKDVMITGLLDRAKTTFIQLENEGTNQSKKMGKRALLYPRVSVVQNKFGCSKTEACILLGVNTGDYGVWVKEQEVNAL